MVNNFLRAMKKYNLNPEIVIDDKPVVDSRDIEAQIALMEAELGINREDK
jgi:hypothetical protein